MNRQELFGTHIVSHEPQLDTTYLPFIKPNRRTNSDVNFPRFFSGWPYFIFVLATLLMGSTKVASQGLERQDPFAEGLRHVAAGFVQFPWTVDNHHRKMGKHVEQNRCEISTASTQVSESSHSSALPWCSKEAAHRNTF